eukprot:5672812-Amphidinium_carterae.1
MDPSCNNLQQVPTSYNNNNNKNKNKNKNNNKNKNKDKDNDNDNDDVDASNVACNVYVLGSSDTSCGHQFLLK